MIDKNMIYEKSNIVKNIYSMFNQTCRIILVGSRVRQDYSENSDWDFVCLINDDIENIKKYPSGRIVINNNIITFCPRTLCQKNLYIYNNTVYELSYYDVDNNLFVSGKDDEQFVTDRKRIRELKLEKMRNST
jgi:predicted nucleotidyltransferase